MTPDEIRRAGGRWPLPGVGASACRPDGAGRIDLQCVLQDLRESLASWQRKANAAGRMASAAAREFEGNHEDAEDARVDLAAKVAGIRGSIAEVERILALQSPPPAAPARNLVRPRRWPTILLGIYLLSALAGAAFLAPAFSAMPSELPRLVWSESMTEDEAVREGERLRVWMDDELPASVPQLAASAWFWFDDRLMTLVSPSDWSKQNTTLLERVETVNECLDEIPVEYWNTVSLLAAIFVSGLITGLLALWRPGLGTAVMVVVPPLFATKIVTAPVIGKQDEALLDRVLPMLVTGGLFLVIQVVRVMKSGVRGRRGDDWLSLWSGLAMIVLGVGVSIGAIVAGEHFGTARLFVAVGPTLYGLFLSVRGAWGLLRSMRGR